MSDVLHLSASFSDVEKGENDGPIKIKGYANTVAKDRVGDVIEASAWTKGGMDDYLKNPIILGYHDRRNPIGKMVDYQVDAYGLEITAQISKTAGNIYDLIKEGILKAFSVGIRVKDADYNSETEIYVIKDLELHEVSVVSIPANQDSLFEISKCFDSEKDYDDFRAKFNKSINTPEKEEEEIMPTELEKLTAQLRAESAENADKAATKAAQEVMAQLEAKEKAAREAELEEARKEAEKEELIRVGASGAERLVADLEAKFAEDLKTQGDTAAEAIKMLQEEIKAKDEEIRQIVDEKTRSNKMSFGEEGKLDQPTEAMVKEAEDALLLGLALDRKMEDTSYGKEFLEKATSNLSSSGAWASAEYWETTVSGNIQRDVEERLVMAPLFQEIQMNTATLVLPTHPGYGTADWVAAAQIRDESRGTPIASNAANRDKTTTDPTLTLQMGEMTLKTNKMAAKTFITDETEEDAVYPILPLLRENLVEAHRRRTETAFLTDDNGVSSSGKANFDGVITLAQDGGRELTSDAQQDGAPAGTQPSKDLLSLRRQLGVKGLDTSNLTCVVSQEWYWRLLEDDKFADVSQVGNIAKKLTGQVGQVYGMPVVVSDMMPADADGSVVAVLVHRPSFLVPRQRGFTMQTDYYVEEQQRVIVSTQRFGFQPLYGLAGSAVLKYAANA